MLNFIKEKLGLNNSLNITIDKSQFKDKASSVNIKLTELNEMYLTALDAILKAEGAVYKGQPLWGIALSLQYFDNETQESASIMFGAPSLIRDAVEKLDEVDQQNLCKPMDKKKITLILIT